MFSGPSFSVVRMYCFSLSYADGKLNILELNNMLVTT